MVRKIALTLALFCAVPLTSGCVTVPSPAALANTTKLDEQGVNTAELAYKAWRIAVETGVNAGQIKGQLAQRVAGFDNQLYSALQAVESAYNAGNASDYKTAVANFNTALTVANSALGGK